MNENKVIRTVPACYTIKITFVGIMLFGSACATGREPCPIGSFSCPCNNAGRCGPGLACREEICVSTNGVSQGRCTGHIAGEFVCADDVLYRCDAGGESRIHDCSRCFENAVDEDEFAVLCEDSPRTPQGWEGPYPYLGPGCYSLFNDRLICGPLDNAPADACLTQRVVLDGEYYCEDGRLSQCRAGTLREIIDCTQCYIEGIPESSNATECRLDRTTPLDWFPFARVPYAGPGCYFGDRREC